MIVKALVMTNAAQDPEKKGRVKIESPRIWENSEDNEYYTPVLNALSLNAGDWVYVLVPDNDFTNPLIIGRCRDNNFKSMVEDMGDFTLLWESVSQPDPDDESTKTWSALFALGDTIYFENSAGVITSIESDAVSLVTNSANLSLDADGNLSAVTKGKVTFQAEEETSAQPVPFGDTLKQQLEALSSRLDVVVDAVGQMLSSGVPAPMDGGAALKTTMTAAWQSSVPNLKSSSPSAEDWSEILNSSVTTAGKV